MSDLHEGFDADAEEALDALLARHQRGLTATVGPALDVFAGLRGTITADDPFAGHAKDHRVSAAVAREAPYGVTRPASEEDGHRSPVLESSSLNGVLAAGRYEIEALDAFAEEIRRLWEEEGLPLTATRPPDVAVLLARDELGRILGLLLLGEVTKESAASEFALAVELVEEQLATWSEARARLAPSLDLAWMEDNFGARLEGLLGLREQVVRLFEDSGAGVFQFS
ncbi:hypothetical protein EDD98_6601 [Streptomyces sp. PanSC19]|uniref:hypothetical protein n=1 Tax=Streptomyces sp. PanSC19 TaxID=1520455 RepID=UPI000F467737|nr:hypothetical protein [Streptomyces sp. PanSC19]ROQ26947.1 hypothetical protein EDD98_6601 [Streptomyces sp. PanSC19]